MSAPPSAGRSPCTGICEIDDGSGYCRGCWRSIGEIIDWPRSSAAQRAAILAQLPARRRGDTRPQRRSGGIE